MNSEERNKSKLKKFWDNVEEDILRWSGSRMECQGYP